MLRCDRFPELCNLPVASKSSDADLKRAIDVVFVSDGFTKDNIGEYRQQVDKLTVALISDSRTILSRAGQLVNIHKVELLSNSSEPRDRVLRSCTDDRDGSKFSAGDDFRVVRAAANAPDADLIIVLVNRTGEWREGVSEPAYGAPIVRIGKNILPAIVSHEMGHILLALADEYVELDGVAPMSAVLAQTTSRGQPNLSLSVDESWGGLVQGAVEGGGRFAKGFFRPTNSCVMNDLYTAKEFCPVCANQLDEMISGREGSQSGAPICGIWVYQNGSGRVGGVVDGGSKGVTYFASDPNGVRFTTLYVNGQVLGKEEDLALRNPLMKRRPLYAETSTGASSGAVLRLECEDELGAHSSASLTVP